MQRRTSGLVALSAAALAAVLGLHASATTPAVVNATDAASYDALHGVAALTHFDPFAPSSTGQTEPVASTPDGPCGPGSLPETTQGRAPHGDYFNGRAAKGYTCNATEVSHFGADGGFHVFRYVDPAGHVCAVYDSAYLFPVNALSDPSTGTYVLDMSDPVHPRRTATLRTIAMQSPHESLRLNDKTGLLIATTGGPTTNLGTMDIYDLRKDCRHPQLRSSLPLNLLGHEGGFSPDGRTYWATITAAGGLTAYDVSNPGVPTVLWSSPQYIVHGLGISDDGNRVYLADLGPVPGNTLLNGGKGLTILDVSQIQNRFFNPKVTKLSSLTWPEVSIPQNNIPVTIHGKEYDVEFDEFDSRVVYYQPESTVGGVHIIDTSDPRHPRIVSRIRLKVWDLAQRASDQQEDPGATHFGQGYAAHYCSVPTTVDPKILACSMIASGLRVFDIRDPLHPREIAYFNKPPIDSPNPLITGSYAMSAPTFDVAHHQIWYSDANSGFYAVHITNGVWPK